MLEDKVKAVLALAADKTGHRPVSTLMVLAGKACMVSMAVRPVHMYQVDMDNTYLLTLAGMFMEHGLRAHMLTRTLLEVC